MPPLHVALVEVHSEYEKVNMAAKDMAEAYKKATTTTDQLQEQYDESQANNVELLAKLQQTWEQLKEAKDRLQVQEGPNRSHENDHRSEEQLRETLKKLEQTTNQATQAEKKVLKLEDRLSMARIDLGKWMDAKDRVIQQLKKKLAQQQDVVAQQVEQMQELEEYIQIQEEYFADRMTESILQTTMAHEEHKKEKERLEAINADLTKNCVELEVKYEQKKLSSLVAEANLMSLK